MQMCKFMGLSKIIAIGLVAFSSSAIAEVTIQTYKDWQVRLIVDDFTDEERVVLNTVVDDVEDDFSPEHRMYLIGSQIEPEKTSDMLVIKCSKANTKPYVVILTNEKIDGDGTRNIEYRVDKRAPQKTLMKTDENYLMLLNHRKAGQFINNIRSGKRLIGRSSDREAGHINFKIPIEGFSDVENELYRYCKPYQEVFLEQRHSIQTFMITGNWVLRSTILSQTCHVFFDCFCEVFTFKSKSKVFRVSIVTFVGWRVNCAVNTDEKHISVFSRWAYSYGITISPNRVYLSKLIFWTS